jgi:hypothetical protein
MVWPAWRGSKRWCRSVRAGVLLTSDALLRERVSVDLAHAGFAIDAAVAWQVYSDAELSALHRGRGAHAGARLADHRRGIHCRLTIIFGGAWARARYQGLIQRVDEMDGAFSLLEREDLVIDLMLCRRSHETRYDVEAWGLQSRAFEGFRQQPSLPL